jgi:K+-transporting ATPase ATPase A chain
MYHEIIICVLIFAASILLALSLGAYMTRVYQDESRLLRFLDPLEKLIFRICKIDPLAEMNWKQYLFAFLSINSLWLAWGIVILVSQGKLFLNPGHIRSMEWTLALNGAISFITSTNLQHYSGETGAAYFSQISVFAFLQFLSAGASLSAGVAVVRGLRIHSSSNLGNFYADFLRSLTRILLPLSCIAAILFMMNGMPMTFHGPQKIVSLQGDTVTVATGPVASMIPIKELGSNGGGFFGPNDAHPFENPNFFTFVIHSILIFLLPIGFIFFIGYYLSARRLSVMLLSIMTAGFLITTVPIIIQEVSGNPLQTSSGINILQGNMEGKEVRFGSFYSAYYSGENVVIPTGSVVASHDSYKPFSAVTMIIGMQIDAFFGGGGTGWINMFMYLIIAVFIGTLMIGRTPEIFGRKIGNREMQIAIGVSISSILLPLACAAIAMMVYLYFPGGNETLGWLSNKGTHGFTTMLYEYVSSYAGNGSEFSGLTGNTPFWNLTTSFVMLCGRFIPIAGALMIAGFLQAKKYTVPSPVTLKVDSPTFGIFLFVLIFILSALSFLPALMIGPLSEHFMIQ